ncbi:hypothetical protein [Saccharothrix sp. Mg75]|uniref:hypothetical protein n=1 Tax=Saccharothrix sp. Mg75 TaxID=3445357 RepID=UPI003EE9CDD8
MIPNQSGSTTGPTAARDHACRWAVKPLTGARGRVDGGWWPRSTAMHAAADPDSTATVEDLLARTPDRGAATATSPA